MVHVVNVYTSLFFITKHQKFVTYCGIDVHKKILVATIATTDKLKITTYQTKQFSTFTKLKILINLNNSLLITIAKMSVWNPLVSIGFLFLAF